MSKARIICLTILLCSVFSFHNTIQAAEYKVIDLGDDWHPNEMNNIGQIVGAKNRYPVVWQDGVITEISQLEGTAEAINDSGDVVGTIGGRAYIWDGNDITFLNPPVSNAKDIHNNGLIAGNATFDGNSHAGYWENNDFVIVASPHWVSGARIPTLFKYFAEKINKYKNIIGYRSSSTATIGWAYGDNLPPFPAYSRINDINDNTQIIGPVFYQILGLDPSPIEAPGYISYGNIYDFTNIVGIANNNLNVVVGLIGYDSDNRAAIYKDGVVCDLNDLIPVSSGWFLRYALAINDLGQIVCYGNLSGRGGYCLLIPGLSYILDLGLEFPVNYDVYGTFYNEGTGNYLYSITDTPGLAAAVGEGIYPNTESVLENSLYQEYLTSGKLTGDVWDFIDSDDPLADYFKWATATGVQEGEKLYYTALALENMGEIKHAIKAYYALIVHFPFTQAYNLFEHIYWYPGITAMDAIERLCRDYPRISYELLNAKITVQNGYDNNPADDIFTAAAGSFALYILQDRIDRSVARLNSEDAAVRGEGKVQVVKRADGSWELRVEGKSFCVRGVTYQPTQVGMIADQQTAWQWLDTNANGLIDAPEEAWVDSNRNNICDFDEPAIGDFQLLKDMGCNAIRFYHYAGLDKKTYQPEEYNKELLRKLYVQYGIRIIMGDFFGAYTIGSGATWEAGTDYTDPEQRANMKEVVRQMVLDHKDEPYVLMWLLGNENNMDSEYNAINATRTNACAEPQAYAEFLNEVAQMIHELDLDHPVAVGNLGLGLVEYYAQYAPELDIIGTNHYTNRDGIGVSFLREAQAKIDRPLLITEYGCDAYHQDEGVNETEQQYHHYGSAKAIYYNGVSTPGEGNVIGSVVFEWLDEWWKANSEYDSPDVHEIAPQFYWGLMPDHFAHAEWFGICGQGDGINSPFLRETREVYDFYKTMWQPSAVFDETAGTVTLTWDGYPGLIYFIEYWDYYHGNFVKAAWNILPSDIGRTSWVDDGSLTGSPPNTMRRDYRVLIDDTYPAQVVLEVSSGQNQTPVADDQTLQIIKNQPFDVTLTGSDADNDSLEFIVVNGPFYGTISGTAPNITYTPDVDFLGEDSIHFVASDGLDESEQATIFLNVLTMLPVNGLQGEYYDNIDFTNLQVVRADDTVDFNWGSGSPDASIGANTFSIRWSGQVAAQYDETYTFYTVSDDGIRLWVNGQLLIENWTVHAPTEDSGTITLVAGQKYDIVMEYYENSWGAELALSWSSASRSKQIIPQAQLYHTLAVQEAPAITTQPQDVSVNTGQTATFTVTASGTAPLSYQWSRDGAVISGATASSYTTPPTVSGDNGAVFSVEISNSYGSVISNDAILTVTVIGAGNGLKGEYYDNIDFTNLQVVRADDTVDFNWGSGSPDASIGANTFSIRWSGQVAAQYDETYTFYTVSDDGIRLWVNGQLLIENWTVHAPTEDSGTITLVAGQKYDIVMEYYENSWGAELALSWSSASRSKQIIPQAQLYH